jgi:lactoylglutathione lyase
MQLSYFTFMIRDMENTVEFYEKAAGLHVIKQFNPGMGDITFMANADGETMLEFIQFDHAEKVSAKGMVMSFQVDESLEAVRDRVASLGYAPSEIIERGPKPKHFHVLDPDGIVVEFSV